MPCVPQPLALGRWPGRGSASCAGSRQTKSQSFFPPKGFRSPMDPTMQSRRKTALMIVLCVIDGTLEMLSQALDSLLSDGVDSQSAKNGVRSVSSKCMTDVVPNEPKGGLQAHSCVAFGADRTKVSKKTCPPEPARARRHVVADETYRCL